MRKPVEGARYSLGLKVTGATKKRIDKAAVASGRTQSQECEIRLEQTFHEQDLLPGIQQLAYGGVVAALVQEFAAAAKTVEWHYHSDAGLPPVSLDLDEVVNELKRVRDDKARVAMQPDPNITHRIHDGRKK